MNVTDCLFERNAALSTGFITSANGGAVFTYLQGNLCLFFCGELLPVRTSTSHKDTGLHKSLYLGKNIAQGNLYSSRTRHALFFGLSSSALPKNGTWCIMSFFARSEACFCLSNIIDVIF